MEENKNVQNNAELTDEELAQTTGGDGYTNMSLQILVCRGCGKCHTFSKRSVPREFTCECGAVTHR